MNLKNTTTQYGSIAKFFHWLIFLLIAWQFIIGFFSENVEKGLHLSSSLFPLHKQIGLALLLLVALRLLWKLYTPRPLLPATIKNWERILAYSTHALLYISIIVMSVSGWIMSTAAGKAPMLWGFKFAFPFIEVSKPLSGQAGDIHLIAAWILLVLVSLHILAALKHYFMDKDNVLQSMLPGK